MILLGQRHNQPRYQTPLPFFPFFKQDLKLQHRAVLGSSCSQQGALPDLIHLQRASEQPVLPWGSAITSLLRRCWIFVRPVHAPGQRLASEHYTGSL